MNNFNLITPEEMVKKHPNITQTVAELRAIASQPDTLCDVCEQANAWKYGETGMCFSCTTGEADASDDYELYLSNPQQENKIHGK